MNFAIAPKIDAGGSWGVGVVFRVGGGTHQIQTTGGCEMVRKMMLKYFPAREDSGTKCTTALRPGKRKEKWVESKSCR